MDSSNLVFDQYQRYATIARLIEYYRQIDKEKKFTILELGANTYKDLALFLPNDNILFSDTQLDENMQNDSEFVQVDGTNIQFSDDTFDFVVAADVLEHVPVNKRFDFILEAYRVAKIGVVVCFPFGESYVNEAEARVNAYYKAISGEDYIWLKEHIDNGLPKITDIENFLGDKKLQYFSLLHGNINLWEKMWYCYFNACFMSGSSEYQSLIDKYYNTTLYQQDIGEECYRKFYVITKLECDSWREYSKTLWHRAKIDKLHFLDELIKAQHDIRKLQIKTMEMKQAEQRAEEFNEAYLAEAKLREAAEKRAAELSDAYLSEAEMRKAAEQRAEEFNEAYLAEAKIREAAEQRAEELNEAYLTESQVRKTSEQRTEELNDAYLSEAKMRKAAEQRAEELNEAYLAEAKIREAAERRAEELNEAYLAEAIARETAEERAEEFYKAYKEEALLREQMGRRY